MIDGKVKAFREKKTGHMVYKIVCYVKDEVTSPPAVPLSPIDCFAAHLPDPRPGVQRRLVRARTNRAGTFLFALVRDVPAGR